MLTSIDRQRLELKIGHPFTDDNLLSLALTHRSCGGLNNERLEFLGDSVLNCVIGEALFRKFPDAKEGQLSHLRSRLVNGATLANMAKQMEIGSCLLLGEGEMKSGGHLRESILADAFEAIIGAIYLDAGWEAAKSAVLRWYSSRLAEVCLEVPKDPKTQLQELMQSRKKPLPIYTVEAVSGESHAQNMTVSCRVSSMAEIETATASSRRKAEKQAAKQMLLRLQQTFPDWFRQRS